MILKADKRGLNKWNQTKLDQIELTCCAYLVISAKE